LVSILSAGVGIGTYSYLNRKNSSHFSFDNSSLQQGFRTVGYATPAENTDFTYAAEQSVNAVVHIKSIMRPSERNRGNRGYIDPFEFFFGERNPYSQPYRQQPRVGFGSGVIISTDGYIVTNNHVIDGADEIEVTTNDNQTFKAKIIGKDSSTDVALLKVEGKDFHTLPFGDSDLLKIGEWVLAVGNPLNLTSTVTAGIVSAKGRSDIMSGYSRNSPQDIQSYIQTDAAINQGNSGGALVNTKGELIGMNTAIYSQSGEFIGYGFAIPVNIIKKVVSDLKQYGIVQRAMLGIYYYEIIPYLKDSIPDVYNKLKVKEGVYVSDFSSNSASQKAGIQKGDVITSINGIKIKNGQELRAQLSSYSPGNKIDIQVQRGDAIKNITVELKNDQGTTEIIKQKAINEILGASFSELSKEMKDRLNINYGIVVSDIGNGKLRSAGFRNGFIVLTANDTRISTVEDLESVITSVLKKEPDERGLLLRYYNSSARRIEYVGIDLRD